MVSARMRRTSVGFVFQSFHLLATRSVLENVMLATAYAGVPREERETLARAALERVGLGHRMEFFPGTLSGGERQRAAIARALVTRPQAVLADEPTGNLDQQTAENVFNLMQGLNTAMKTAFVVVTHDLQLASRMDTVYRITAGTLTRER